MLETPFVVFRDYQNSEILEMPLPELFEMQRKAEALVAATEAGDPQARQAIEEVKQNVVNPRGRQRGLAVVSMFLINDAKARRDQARLAYEAQARAQRSSGPAVIDVPAEVVPSSPSPAPPDMVGATQSAPQASSVEFCAHGCPIDVVCGDCRAASIREAARGAPPVPSAEVV